MPRRVPLLIALAALALPAAARAQAAATVEVQVTVAQPPSYLASAPAGAGLGLRLVGSPNCTVSAAVDGAPVPLGPCAPTGLLTATAQRTLGRAARGGREVVVTMTIDAGT